jgi:hypothetical protein
MKLADPFKCSHSNSEEKPILGNATGILTELDQMRTTRRLLDIVSVTEVRLEDIFTRKEGDLPPTFPRMATKCYSRCPKNVSMRLPWTKWLQI